MIKKLKALKFLLIIIAVAQTLILLGMLVSWNQRLAGGNEVLLEARMIDPRDLFRGHYVSLNLAISTVDTSKVEIIGDMQRGDAVFATLKPSEEIFWVIDTISIEKPKGGQNFLSAVLKTDINATGQKTARLQLPFNRYFAEKKDALELEKINSEGNLGIIVSVGKNGTGVIKGLVLNGEKIYDKALF